MQTVLLHLISSLAKAKPSLLLETAQVSACVHCSEMFAAIPYAFVTVIL